MPEPLRDLAGASLTLPSEVLTYYPMRNGNIDFAVGCATRGAFTVDVSSTQAIRRPREARAGAAPWAGFDWPWRFASGSGKRPAPFVLASGRQALTGAARSAGGRATRAEQAPERTTNPGWPWDFTPRPPPTSTPNADRLVEHQGLVGAGVMPTGVPQAQNASLPTTLMALLEPTLVVPAVLDCQLFTDPQVRIGTR